MTLSIQDQLIWIALGSAAVMFVLWLVQMRTKDAGVVDVAWSALLGSAAIFAALTGDGDVNRRILIGSIAGLWGLRLATHLLFDRVLKGPEDGRYQMLREKYPKKIQPILLGFFEAQALLVVILCPPFLLAAGNESAIGALDIAGLVLFLVGISGEWIADHQLKAFKANGSNKGKVCDIGLWRYSRHPNYFFEWLMWCSYALIGFSAPMGYIAIASPLLILLLVLKVTGIPPTEARALKTRPEAYKRYQQTTSAFFPWFPKAAGAAKDAQ